MEIALSSVHAMMLSMVILLAIILVCIIFFYIRKKNTVQIFLLGMLGYFIPQVLFRYPLITWMQTAVFPSMNLYVVILLLSLSTALLETIGRYIVIRKGLKNDQTRMAGIISGMGHGVCEILFLLGITYLNNLFILYLAQKGGNSTQINFVLSAIDQIPLTAFYFTLLERCLFIIIQTGLSSVLMNGIIKKRKRIVLFVFLLHFIIDISITIMSQQGIDIMVMDGVIFGISIIAFIYMWKSETWFPAKKEIDEEQILEEMAEDENS